MQIYQLMEMRDPIEGSVMWKLQKINNSVKRIKSQYKDVVNPLIASELSQYISQSANKSLVDDIKKKQQEQLNVDNKFIQNGCWAIAITINNTKKNIIKTKNFFHNADVQHPAL